MNEFGDQPGRQDLRAYQGDTFTLKVTLEQEDSNPVDLTGMIVEFGEAVARGGRPSFLYSTEDYITVSDPTSGEFEIRVPDFETRKWQHGRYKYEVTIKDGLGYAKTFLTGRLLVTREVVV